MHPKVRYIAIVDGGFQRESPRLQYRLYWQKRTETLYASKHPLCSAPSLREQAAGFSSLSGPAQQRAHESRQPPLCPTLAPLGPLRSLLPQGSASPGQRMSKLIVRSTSPSRSPAPASAARGSYPPSGPWRSLCYQSPSRRPCPHTHCPSSDPHLTPRPSSRPPPRPLPLAC